MQCPHCEKWSASERRCEHCGASLINTRSIVRPASGACAGVGAALSPYAPPVAGSVPAVAAGELASRWRRLGATLIDAILLILVVTLCVFTPLREQMGHPVVGAVLGVIAFLLLNSVLLVSSGQTVGKRLLGIRIATGAGTTPGFGHLLVFRYLPFWIVGAIPMVGPLFSLVDSLFIFSDDQRCLHDRLAGTVVLRTA